MPQSVKVDPVPFASMLTDGPFTVVMVTTRFEEIIHESFAADAKRNLVNKGKTMVEIKITLAELKRRFNILAEWFKILKGDLGWSVQHVVDELPTILRTQLDGGTYVPPPRGMWVPSKEEQS